jgi:hypothetical protein
MDARSFGHFDGWASVRRAYPEMPFRRALMYMRLGLLSMEPPMTCGLAVEKLPSGRFRVLGGRDLPSRPRPAVRFRGTIRGAYVGQVFTVSMETGRG